MKTMLLSVGATALLLVGIAVVSTADPATLKIGSAGSDSPQVVRVGTMPIDRAAHQATLLNTGKVLVTGGCAGSGCDSVLSSSELYDPATRSFAAAAPMSIPRASHVAVPLPDGRVLVAGGWSGQSATASAEIYDPATSRWAPAGEMNQPSESPIGVPLPGGRVLLIGGEARTGSASAEIFDPATDTFSPVGPMQTFRGSPVAIRLPDGRALVTGGRQAQGEVLRSAEIFDPATGQFVRTGDMTVARHKHAVALLPDGRVLVVGGSDARDYRGRYSSTEIFDPATGEFLPGPKLHSPRHKLRDAVVTLPSGAVLVAGGAVRPEIFDPAGRVFVSAKGQLSGPQMFATATLLPGGEVLVLGGYDQRIRPSAAAWLIVAED